MIKHTETVGTLRKEILQHKINLEKMKSLENQLNNETRRNLTLEDDIE